MYVIHSRSSLKNHTRFQTKMDKVYTHFQTKMAQKTLPFGAAHTYTAYVREYFPTSAPPQPSPPPPPPPGAYYKDRRINYAAYL